MIVFQSGKNCTISFDTEKGARRFLAECEDYANFTKRSTDLARVERLRLSIEEQCRG